MRERRLSAGSMSSGRPRDLALCYSSRLVSGRIRGGKTRQSGKCRVSPGGYRPSRPGRSYPKRIVSMTANARMPGDWWTLAACRTAEPELFFPISTKGRSRADVARAHAVCFGCQVRRPCLDYALADQQNLGI